jgi:Zn-dependent protease with chaperone function
LSVAKLAAFVFALTVHLATLSIAVAGFALLWLGVTHNVVLLVPAVLFVGMAWLLRPRFPVMPVRSEASKDVIHIRRLADDVADAVGADPASEFVVVGEFNAAVTTSGWRRTRVMVIGLPLFAVLSGQERVAVLAHEFAHYANGDPRRGWIVGSALSSLAAWHDVLAPWSIGEGVVQRLSTDHFQPFGVSSGPGMMGIATAFVNAVLEVLSLIPLGLYRLLEKLILRESQRAEYLADAIAVRVAGSQAVTSLFDKLDLDRSYRDAAAATSASRWRNHSLWDEMRARAAEFPESERQRARAAHRATNSRLDRTHPVTSSRIDAIATRGIVPALLVIADARSQQVDADLMRLLPRVENDVIDRYLDSIHAG